MSSWSAARPLRHTLHVIHQPSSCVGYVVVWMSFGSYVNSDNRIRYRGMALQQFVDKLYCIQISCASFWRWSYRLKLFTKFQVYFWHFSCKINLVCGLLKPVWPVFRCKWEHLKEGWCRVFASMFLVVIQQSHQQLLYCTKYESRNVHSFAVHLDHAFYLSNWMHNEFALENW